MHVKAQSLEQGLPVVVMREGQPGWKAVSKGAWRQRESKVSGKPDHA